jgi:FtsP/CotA-like multicopper oxidase with cupredoxin domain
VAGALSTARIAEAIYDGRTRGVMPRGLTGVPATGSKPGRTKKVLSLVGTDGWASMPVGANALPPYYPDVTAPENTDTYIFGFRDVTGLSQDVVSGQKNKVQISAPLIDVNADEELWITLANLGLQLRPDLVDSHTLHWHGFRNAIPFYDGVPETSIAVPIGRQFTYVYRPDDPGTYMYHCHFEDVEHVTMGMTGIVFVRPNRNQYSAAAKDAARNIVKLVYDDPAVKAGGPVTSSPYYFDREYSIILTEIDSRAHFQDAHILETDWTDFRPNFWLMNGRAYPDTLEPNAPVDTVVGPNFGKPAREADGTLQAPVVSRDGTGRYAGPALPHLKNQPQSSLIVAAPGERVLLRLVNLGFGEQSLTLPGIEMHTVGSDARPLSADTQTKTDIVTLGAGESHDVIITAPTAGEYALYNRDMGRYAGIDGDSWFGGQRTSVIVKSGIGPQLYDNHWDPAWL